MLLSLTGEAKKEFLESLVSPKMIEEACGKEPTIVKYNFELFNIGFLLILIVVLSILAKKNFNVIKSFLVDKNNLNKKLIICSLIIMLTLIFSYFLKDNHMQNKRIKTFFYNKYELSKSSREHKENPKVKQYEICVQNYRDSRK
jgi:hypothetical protein